MQIMKKEEIKIPIISPHALINSPASYNQFLKFQFKEEVDASDEHFNSKTYKLTRFITFFNSMHDEAN